MHPKTPVLGSGHLSPICLLPTDRFRKRHWNYGPLFQIKVQCRTDYFVNNAHFFQECPHGVLGAVAAWTAATWMGVVSQGFVMHPQNGDQPPEAVRNLSVPWSYWAGPRCHQGQKSSGPNGYPDPSWHVCLCRNYGILELWYLFIDLFFIQLWFESGYS